MPFVPDTDTRRVALVTGAARGIGRAVATALARDGFAVVVNCSGEKSLPAAQEFADELAETYGVPAAACAADVSDADAVDALFAFVADTYGRLDVLVNNAGITRDGSLLRMSEDDFDRVIAVNLKSAFLTSRRAAKIMMKQRWGRIINMASIVGVVGNAGQANYAASKAGIIGLTKTIAREFGARHITANAIAPGFIATDMTAELPEKMLAGMNDRIALKRMGKPEEVAELAAFLASDRAAYITGQVIGIDGGMSL